MALLGYLVAKDGVLWTNPKSKQSIHGLFLATFLKIRSFHGLASFYRSFVHDFITIASPTTVCLKKGVFAWGEEDQKSFEKLKALLCDALILVLPDFSQPFEVGCDTSGVSTGVVLIQSKHLVPYYSKKLGGVRLNWCTYDNEFYATVRALHY